MKGIESFGRAQISGFVIQLRYELLSSKWRAIRTCYSHIRVCEPILIIKPNRCTNFSNLFFGIKLYMFRTVPLCIIKSYSLYTQQRYMSYRLQLQLASRIRIESVLILLASCQQTCMTWTVAVCTVKNCWWWTEELFETCRVLFQK